MGLPGVGHGRMVDTSSQASSKTPRRVNVSFLLHASSLSGLARGFPRVEGKKLKLPLTAGAELSCPDMSWAPAVRAISSQLWALESHGSLPCVG